MTKLLLLMSLFTVGCATNYKNAWKTEDQKPSATISGKGSLVTVTPEGLNSNYFSLMVEYKNTSADSSELDVSNIKIKNSKGEIIEPLTSAELDNKINGSVATAGMIAGGGYYSNQLAASNIKNEVNAKLIKNGRIPASSTKSGAIYFEGSKCFGDFSVVIMKPLVDKDTEVKFTFNGKK